MKHGENIIVIWYYSAYYTYFAYLIICGWRLLGAGREATVPAAEEWSAAKGGGWQNGDQRPGSSRANEQHLAECWTVEAKLAGEGCLTLLIV